MKNPIRRRIARPLFYISLLCLLAALVLTLLSVPVYPGLLLGLSLLTLGLNALIGGDVIVGGIPRQFVAKGNVVRGKVTVKAGLSDLVMSNGPNNRVATVRSGPLGKPKFVIKDGIAYLEVKQPRLLKNINEWQVGVATNMLWDLDLSSTLGDIAIDMHQMRVEHASLRSKSGNMAVRLPARGAATVEITAGIGEVDITLPSKVGVRIVIPPKELVNVRVETSRVQPLGIDAYITPNFERADTQIEVIVNARAADIIITES